MIGDIVDSNAINVTEIMALTSDMVQAAGLNENKELLLAKELYLTKAELREMQAYGLSIEVHGHEHLPPANLGRIELEKEIRKSISYVIKELNGKPEFYSLPYGVDNQFVNDVADDVKLCGIASAEQRLVKLDEDLYRLPRICVTTDNMHLYRRLARSCGKVFLDKLRLVKLDH